MVIIVREPQCSTSTSVEHGMGRTCTQASMGQRFSVSAAGSGEELHPFAEIGRATHACHGYPSLPRKEAWPPPASDGASVERGRRPEDLESTQWGKLSGSQSATTSRQETCAHAREQHVWRWSRLLTGLLLLSWLGVVLWWQLRWWEVAGQ